MREHHNNEHRQCEYKQSNHQYAYGATTFNLFKFADSAQGFHLIRILGKDAVLLFQLVEGCCELPVHGRDVVCLDRGKSIDGLLEEREEFAVHGSKLGDVRIGGSRRARRRDDESVVGCLFGVKLGLQADV